MAGSSYLFACGHPQKEAGAIRLWEAIQNTDILPQVLQSDSVKLPHLSCSACRDQKSGNIREHLQHLTLRFTELAVANLAEMSQLLWEQLQLRSQPGRAPEFHELTALWTHVLTGLLTPSQYEGPLLSAVLRLHGLDALRDVTEAGRHSFHGLYALWGRCHALLGEMRRGGACRARAAAAAAAAAIEGTMREANDSVLAEATLLIERDGEEETGVPDAERLRVDYNLQLLLCDALSCAYEHQDSISGALRRAGPGRRRALMWAEESMGPFWLACVGVRKRALDLVKFRGE